jgi:hypothetical protein
MERPMTYLKTEHSFVPQFSFHVPARNLDLAALVATVSAPVVLLLWLLPLPLVLPALSIVSFIIACGIALFAYCSGIDRHAPDVTPWDIAALFTLIWICAGMITGPKRIVELFEHLAMAS